MAYVDPTQPDQEENQKDPTQVDKALNPTQSGSGQTSTDTAPPSTSDGGAGVVSGGAAPGGSSASPQGGAKPSTSGSWTNLDSYLNANADQGATVGNQIAGSVNAAGTQAQNDVTNLGTNFKSAVDQNTVNQDPNAVNDAINAATSATPGQGLTQDQIDAYNKQANASYSGPTDVTTDQNYGKTQQDINNAANLATATQSEGGRDVLLNNQYQNSSVNGYTQGENNLDQLLLQNSQGGQAALQPLAQQWSGLTGVLNNTVSAGNAAATSAATTNQSTAATAKAALDAAAQNYQSNIAAEQAAAAAKALEFQQRLTDGQLNRDDYTGLGMSNLNNWGIDPTKYFSPTPVTNANVTTANQKAQYDALLQLAGQGGNSGLSSLYSGATPEEFGSSQPGLDLSGYNQAVSAAKTAVVKDDLLGAMSGINPGNTPEAISVVNQIRKGVSAGTMTPEQAYSAYQQFMNDTTLKNGAGSDVVKYYQGVFSPLVNYYNNDYLPRSQAQLGDQPPPALPTNPDGSINWGAITAPKGK